ncbi:hypothetical protein JCM10212_000104 [Sporobolomyces blumeae]
MQTASFSPPLFSPVPSPPPPSPAVSPHGHPLRRFPSKRATFDILATSPESWDAYEKTLLKSRLDRSRQLKIAVKPGVPARLLTSKELLTSSSSGTDTASKTKGPEPDGRKHDRRNSSSSLSSPWATDSDQAPHPETSPRRKASQRVSAQGAQTRPPNQDERVRAPASRPVPPVRRTSATKKTTRITEGFEVPTPTRNPVSSGHASDHSSSTCTQPSRSASPTSSLSLLFSRNLPGPAPSNAPASLPTELSNSLTGQRTARKPWNGDVVAAALARDRRPSASSGVVRTESTAGQLPPRAMQTFPPLTINTSTKSLGPSSSLPAFGSSSNLASTKRARFLTPSHSLTSTPNPSPPLSPVMSTADAKSLSLQFCRRPGFTRKGSMGESFSKLCEPQKERERAVARSRNGSLLREGSLGRVADAAETEAEVTDTEVEVSETEELCRDQFQTSVFASNYSNSATSLSSASSSVLAGSAASASPKSTLGSSSLSAAFSVSTPSVSPSNQDSHRRVSSEPSNAAVLKTLRRQQLERKKQVEDLESDSSDEPPCSTTIATARVGRDRRASPKPASGMRRLFALS